MPLNKMDSFEALPSVSLRGWKDGETKTFEFMDDGKDVTTANGASVIYTVKVGKNTSLNSLWIRPGGALHIGLNDLLPLEGKTVKVTKQILKGDIVKGTRYEAIEI